MKRIAYTALHYGADYLAYAIKSVIDFVDQYYVLYTATGSHGSRASEPCPDSRQQLFEIASAAAGNKLVWIDGSWARESDQRSYIHLLVPDAHMILILDSDEVWHPKTLALVESESNYQGSAIRIPFIHYWRSFHRAITHDPAAPPRILFPQAQRKDWILDAGLEYAVNHFGYAQRSEIVRYKLLTHGHRAEFRHDVDWLRDVYMANRQTDLHPVGSQYWNAEPVDPLNYMPDFMSKHPYFKLELIP